MKQIFLFIGLVFLVACQQEPIHKEHSEAIFRKDSNVVIANKNFAQISVLSTVSTTTKDTFLIKKKRPNKINDKIIEIEEAFTLNPYKNRQDNITPGTINNTVSHNNNKLNFLSVSVFTKDNRVGCSGGSDRISFSVDQVKDSFRYDNLSLKALNFKYSMNGGMVFKTGEDPSKGFIKGKLLPDNNWAIEINVWLKTKIEPLNNDEEELIKLKQVFVNKKIN